MKGRWSDHFPAATTTKMVDVSPCKEKGLWSELFTHADKEAAPPDRSQRCLLCPHCNAATCRLLTANTAQNRGRQFYTCPSCNKFVKWADEVNQNVFIDVPYCGGCTAGVCRVRRETRGPNAGRILFMCRVEEGEGSCGYRVWQDELEISAKSRAEEIINSSESAINCDDTGAPKTDLVEESKQTDERVDIISPRIDTKEHRKCREIIPRKVGQLKFQEDKLSESSRRPHKRSRRGDAIASASFHSLKVRLSMNSWPIRSSWIEDANGQNLSSQLRGWWGRLAFHPMPSLTTYVSKPFSCYSSAPSDFTFIVQGHILEDNIDSIPLARSRGGVESYSKPLFNLKKCRNALDFIPVVQDEILENSSDSITLSRSFLGADGHNKTLFTPVQLHDAEITGIVPLRVAVDVPSCSKPPNKTIVQNVMSKSISNAFSEAAERLQNDLVALLEKMDVKDHKVMSQAAEATFDALDRLLFDHQEFKKRVNDLIHYASLIVDIELAMPTNDCHEKLVEHCSSERMRLEEINSVHTKAIDVATNIKKLRKDLQVEISSTMDWLFQIEAELSCSEVEMRYMERELELISKGKEVLEVNYLKASMELEESQKLFEQKEAERKAAKAAFDRARASLRG